jgi:hypothetical protein
MVIAAYLVLILGAALGAAWLLMHVGPGWPSGTNDPTRLEGRIIGTTSLVLLGVSLLLAMAALVRP